GRAVPLVGARKSRLNSIVRKIHPSKIANLMVARRARVRVAAKVGLERRNCMPARCGHCSTCASDQMLRRIIPTAERTVTRDGDKKTLTTETRLENEPLLNGIIVPRRGRSSATRGRPSVKKFSRIGVHLAKN